MPDLEPITREEKLWSGENIVPITREEMYIKHIYDKTQKIPSKPITRKEMLLERAGEGGGSDVTIKQLSVTANGTYSEEGTAYSPVIVNVPKTPLPSNAYLLKEIEDVDIATFSDGSNLPMPSLNVSIEAVQDLHGYDAPWVGGAGKNKFNIATISVKEYIGENGNLYSSNNWSASDFISVDSETAYVLSGITNSGSLAKHIFYDSNKVFISVINSTVMNFTTPSNAKYIRISLNSETPTNVQLEKGSTATSFAPYSNICPISGWDEVNVSVSGVNVWDEEWVLTGINANTGTVGTWTDRIASKNFISAKASTSYYLQAPSTTWYPHCYDKNKNWLGRAITSNGEGYIEIRGIFTTLPNTAYIKLSAANNSYGTTYNNDISINYPSTDTSYHAYNGATYTIDLDGTRYGGEVDVVSGVLTVDRAYVDLGTLNWTKYNVTEGALFRSSLLTIKTSPNSSYFPNILCSKYVTSTQAERTNGTISQAVLNQGVDIIDNAYSDAETFKAAMSGVQLVYELATPIEVQLTPTAVKSLLGSNNVYANTGDITDAEYFSKEV